MSSTEPSISQFPFAGWVPTANGRLSFRHLGESPHPSESIYANVSTERRRLVLAYQHRRLSDVLFQGILHYFCNINGDFWFVLTAESNGSPSDTEEMFGNIFIYKSKSDWRLQAEEVIRSRIYAINDVRLTANPDRDANINAFFEAAKRHAENTADIRISFRLTRSGESYFSRPQFSDADLQYASVDYANSLHQDFPKWVADQSYFFLRDLTHRHQHHPDSSDTILTLQVRDKEGIRWRRNIIYSLHHYIIRSKRELEAPSLHKAAGILAYCNSFYEIARRRLGRRISNIPPFNNEALLASLNARAAEETYRSAEMGVSSILRITRAANARLFVLAIAAIATAILVMLVQPQIERDKIPTLITIAHLAGFHFPEILGFIVFSVVTVWIATNPGWYVSSQFGRDLLEASNVRRVSAITIYTLAAVAIGIITIFWLGAPAIHSIIGIFKSLISFFTSPT